MLKQTDNLFSLNTVKSKDMNCYSTFVYNFYEKNESVVDDSRIISSDFSYKKKRFVRITFENLNENDRVEYNRDNYLQSINDLSLRSLNLNDIKIFNKIDNISSKRRFVINTLDEKERNDILAYYNKSIDSSFSKDIEYSYRMSYLKPDTFNNDLHLLSSKSMFPENGLKEIDENYDDLILKNNRRSTENDSQENSETDIRGHIFSNLNVLEKSVNVIEDYKADYAKYNGVRCGLLIEKYIFENEEYRLLCGKFFTNNTSSEELIINNTIEDEAVKYGKTYRYVAYNVYLYSELDTNDLCILNKYLICDHPFIMKNVECVETEPPPPPVNLRFRLIDTKSVEITWNEPTDYQYDAKGYQILKRQSLEEPFEVIAQLEGHLETDAYFPTENVQESLIKRTPGKIPYRFIDNDFEKGKPTIYTIRTIDAHGYFSKYSEQIAILHDPFADKIIYDLVSYSGASRNFPNEKSISKTMFFEYEDKIVDNLPILKNIKSISLYVTPDYSEVETSEDNLHKVFKNNDKFKFTIFRVNDLKKYEKQFRITNFIQE